MKRMLLFIGAITMLVACSKKGGNDEMLDKWNGYSNLKEGELVRTLWAGQHDSAGYVTYGIDEDANFYATYTTVDGWEMSETHFFAGDKGEMPVNKPGKPKVGKFPYKSNFNPKVTEVTYTIELIELPQAEEDGFVAAAHAVVHNSNTGQQETAWGFGDYVFSDKGWGWYTTYWYQQQQNPFTILYTMDYADDTMYLYMIDATNKTLDTTYKEELILDVNETIDAFAYDESTSNLLFATYLQGQPSELRAINLNDDAGSYSVGTLDGVAASATFSNGMFYYVDELTNNIKEVTLTGTETLSLTNETLFSEIPTAITVNDIAFEPTEENIYIVGTYTVNGETSVEFIGFEVSTDTYSTITFDDPIAPDAQIAYGDDGDLYMVSGTEPGDGSIVSTLSPETGVINPIDEDDVIIVDPFADMAGGPLK